MNQTHKIHFYPTPCQYSLNVDEYRDIWRVTCRVCLYHLGLYMPLVKLREHQIAQGAPAGFHTLNPCDVAVRRSV